MVAAYTFGVLLLSLGGQVEHDLIGSPNAFLNSAVLSLFPVVMGATGIILSALYLLGYLSMGALAPVLGAIAAARGLGPAVDLGAAGIILTNVVTLILATMTPSATSHPSPST
jgi:hypothetical protein